ncbi:MAG: 23S rRNA (adenine(2503)-C(2))-methyltransferase RlmN [Dehalococcoidia bacterium]
MTIDVFGLLPTELEERLAELGAERYRADQILQALYRQGVPALGQVTTIPAALRSRLAAEDFDATLADPVRIVSSEDGQTTKALLPIESGTLIETVLMQYGSEQGKPRNTVCVSTQAGCAMGCVFCATGQMGFERNLSAGEVVRQVMHFERVLQSRGQRVTNLVFMGMGEPLANYNATVKAIRILTDPRALGLGQRRITVSTVGIARAIERLAEEDLQIGLAISLHAPGNQLRAELVPTAAPRSVDDLLAAASAYERKTGRRVSFEYALIAGVNDDEETATALGALLGPRRAHLNVIPLNPTAGSFARPSRNSVRRFKTILDAAGVNCTIRIEKGVEISAACGQLRTGEGIVSVEAAEPGTQ